MGVVQRSSTWGKHPSKSLMLNLHETTPEYLHRSFLDAGLGGLQAKFIGPSEHSELPAMTPNPPKKPDLYAVCHPVLTLDNTSWGFKPKRVS